MVGVFKLPLAVKDDSPAAPPVCTLLIIDGAGLLALAVPMTLAPNKLNNDSQSALAACEDGTEGEGLLK